jgi:tetratricopeptide (TPR) repeat protein
MGADSGSEGERFIRFRALLARGHTEAVAAILGEGFMSIHVVAKLLADGEAAVRKNAALAFREAARNNVKLEMAVRALGAALSDESVDVRWYAGLALGTAAVNGTSIAVATEALVKALEDKNFFIRKLVADVLGEAAREKTDISVAVPGLEKALKDRSYIRASAAKALGRAAENGTDISVAVPALTETLRNALSGAQGNGDVKTNAVLALYSAAAKGVDINAAVEELGKALCDEDSQVQNLASRALRHAAENGADMRAAAGPLGRALWGDAVLIDIHSALGYALANGKSGDAPLDVLAKALMDPGAAWSAVRAFEEAIEKYATVGQLDALEARLRQEHRAMRAKSRCGRDGELAEIRVQFSRVMNRIANKRDMLAARRDIMLEDMPKAPKQGQVYREMRRVLRHG